jgi:hypothetical protein
MSNPLSISLSTATSACPVRSFNEWDPLEEVIVGSLDYATKPYHGDTHDFPARRPALPLVQPPVQSFVATLFWAQSSLEGYTDHVWTFRELLTVKFKPLDSQSICR